MLKRKTEIGLIICSALILCIAGAINHFPLIYSDTADYLGGAFGHYIPIDRPVFYGIFMRVISLQASLWLVIFVQGLLTSYLLLETFGIFYEGNKRNFLFIVSIGILTVCTGISENVSLLLPDIFTPIGIMCFINLLLNTRLSLWRKGFMSFILILCMMFHFSNMLVMFSLLILLWAYQLIKRLKKRNLSLSNSKLALCSALTLSILILVPTGNYMFGKKFTVSDGAHVFIMNHLIETGILEEYLNDQCAHKNYKLCEYKDHIDTNFIWSSSSVFTKVGGWDGSKDEFDKIIYDIFTTPRYERMVIQRFTEYSVIQFFSFAFHENHNWGIPPYIKNNYKLYGRDFADSFQSHNKLNYKARGLIEQFLVLAGLALILYVLLTPSVFNRLSSELKWFTILLLVYSILNSIICSNFSTLSNRFQNRLIWLIPLNAFFIIEYLIRQKKKEIEPADSSGYFW